jgi:Tfp pilus assembly protein PilO
MKLSKKEKTLLIVFAVLVYAFVFAKFVLMPSLPKIKDTQKRIEEAKSQLNALENDYKNIDKYKKRIEENKVVDERLGEYLMNSAGLSDSIEFIENLALLIGTNLKSVSLGNPQQLMKGETAYYAFPISFKTVLSEDGLNEFIRFCEGGSRKVTVRQLTINPANDKSAAEYGIVGLNEQIFNINIGLTFYSMNKDAADSFLKYTRAAFERFKDEDGNPVFIEDSKDIADNTPSQTAPAKSAAVKDSGNTSNEITLMNADFKIFHTGYLYGGYNFETYTAFNRNNRVRSTISVPMDVSLTLGSTQYTIECVDGDGHMDSITGSLPDRDFTLYVQSNIKNDVKEDENLWLNLRIRNDSGKIIVAKIEQTGDRVKLTDRDGNEIGGKSEKEKVYL